MGVKQGKNKGEVVITRRRFLKLIGASAAALSLSQGIKSRYLVPSATAKAKKLGETKTFQTVCGICDSECMVRATVVDGKVVELEGMPGDLAGDGKLCVKGLSGYRSLYDPNRIKGPLMRTNPERGIGVDPKWKEVSWEEAYQMVGKKLKEISEKYGPESIVCLMRPKEEQTHFVKAIGTPNHVCHVDTCYLSSEVAGSLTYKFDPEQKKKGKSWVWDYKNAKYILGFGYDQLGKSKRVYARQFQEAKDKGAKIVILDPRLSITAAKADEWIPIKPGTDLAFALAMINVIINENLYDAQYVAECTFGFDKLKAHIQKYTPEWAQDICEIPADKIKRIAKEFATTRLAVVALHKRDATGPIYTNSFHLARCAFILNALVGSIDQEGGHLMPRKPDMPKFDDVFKFDYPKPRTKERVDGLDKWPLAEPFKKASFSNLAEGILSQKPYPTKALVVHKYNITSFPNPDRMIEAIKTLDFVVVFDVFPSEMAQLADVVLPGYLYLEGGPGYAVRDYSAWYPHIVYKEGIEPVHNVKKLNESFNEILKAKGLSQFVVDWKAFSKAKLDSLGITLDDIKNSPNGIWGTPESFKPKKEFVTPSKKIELYSNWLAQKGYDPLPIWADKKERPKADNEFYYLTNHLAWYRMGNPVLINDPLLSRLQPENYCWINPKSANKLGIKDGDKVKLSSEYGSIVLKAKLYEGIRPDCVMTEHGYGHWSKGLSVAYNRGVNDGEVMPNWKAEEKLKLKDPSCSSALVDVVVKVKKAE